MLYNRHTNQFLQSFCIAFLYYSHVTQEKQAKLLFSAAQRHTGAITRPRHAMRHHDAICDVTMHPLAPQLGKPKMRAGSCCQGWGDFAWAAAVGTQARSWLCDLGSHERGCTHTPTASPIGEAIGKHMLAPISPNGTYGRCHIMTQYWPQQQYS